MPRPLLYRLSNAKGSLFTLLRRAFCSWRLETSMIVWKITDLQRFVRHSWCETGYGQSLLNSCHDLQGTSQICSHTIGKRCRPRLGHAYIAELQWVFITSSIWSVSIEYLPSIIIPCTLYAHHDLLESVDRNWKHLSRTAWAQPQFQERVNHIGVVHIDIEFVLTQQLLCSIMESWLVKIIMFRCLYCTPSAIGNQVLTKQYWYLLIETD